jgi:hypothetical protein
MSGSADTDIKDGGDHEITETHERKKDEKKDRKIKGRKMTDGLTGDNRDPAFSSVFSVCSYSKSSS